MEVKKENGGIDFHSINNDDLLIKYLLSMTNHPSVLSNIPLFVRIKGLLSIDRRYFHEVRKEAQDLLKIWWVEPSSPLPRTSVTTTIAVNTTTSPCFGNGRDDNNSDKGVDGNRSLSITGFLKYKRRDQNFITNMGGCILFRQKNLFWKSMWLKDDELFSSPSCSIAKIESAFGWMREDSQEKRLMGAIQCITDELIHWIGDLESLPIGLLDGIKSDISTLKEKYIQQEIPNLMGKQDNTIDKEYGGRWTSLKKMVKEIDGIHESILVRQEELRKKEIHEKRTKPVMGVNLHPPSSSHVRRDPNSNSYSDPSVPLSSTIVVDTKREEEDKMECD